jgi:hypothetical protein
MAFPVTEEEYKMSVFLDIIERIFFHARVDVDEVLTQLAEKKDERLDWRNSVVDLLKLLDIDSSLQNRRELAFDVGYGDDLSDSAQANMWLHKYIMRRLAETGGVVPPELL